MCVRVMSITMRIVLMSLTMIVLLIVLLRALLCVLMFFDGACAADCAVVASSACG